MQLRNLYKDQIKNLKSNIGPSDRNFSETWFQEILPDYCTDSFSNLHKKLFDVLPTHSRGHRINIRAPRGSGKTVVGTLGYPLHQALEKLDKTILINSNSKDLSVNFLEDIKREIEQNPKIRKYYPDCAGKGPLWRKTKIVLRNGVTIFASSVGSTLRGIRQGANRPTLIITDDLNDDRDIFSAVERRKKLRWFQSTLLPIGQPSTNYINIGTPLHRGAIVSELTSGEMAPMWETYRFKSIEKYPENQELWSEWERILTNIANPHRVEEADQFFEDHREEMEAGSEVLWPDRFDIATLMKYSLSLGRLAFASEYQDEPGTDGIAEFDATWFDDPNIWFDRWPDDSELAYKLVALDPSKGLYDRAGDYQAHVVLGMSANGQEFYVDPYLMRESAPDMVRRSLALAYEAKASEIWVENNGTMGLIEPVFETAMSERREKFAIPIIAGIHTIPKISRIRRLAIYLERKRIKIRRTNHGRLLVDQLREFPLGDYDDGPDCLASAIARLEMIFLA